MLHTVLNEATVPSGEFGDFQTEGNPPGSVQFTNLGRVAGRVSIHGSNDGVKWSKIGKVKAGPGRTQLKKLKTVPKYLFFHNARVPFGPADLTVNSSD